MSHNGVQGNHTSDFVLKVFCSSTTVPYRIPLFSGELKPDLLESQIHYLTFRGRMEAVEEEQLPICAF